MKKLVFHFFFIVFAALVPGEPLLAQAYHDNVVIVLDASGSMRGALTGTGLSKIDGAKTALKEVVQKIPASTHVGLLVFSASNLTNEWAYPLGPRDDAALLQAIDLPEPHQGTPLGAYIKKGADRLLQERAKQFGYGTYRLLVVTDGEADERDRPLVDRYTPEVISRGITMDVIGVGMSKRHTLATKVHSYRAANDPGALKKALQDVFAEVANTSDGTPDDVFTQIAGIPSEVAAAALQTLAATGNTPIGQKPAVSKASQSPRTARQPERSAPVTPAVPVVAARKRLPVGLIIFIVALVVFFVLKARGRARS